LLHRIGGIESKLYETDIDRPRDRALPTFLRPLARSRTALLPRHTIGVRIIERAPKPLQLENKSCALRSGAFLAWLANPAWLAIVIELWPDISRHD
jgi:hypothetical protein